jgi:hypothetical protein
VIQVYSIADGKLAEISNKRLPKEDDLQRWIADNPQIIGLNLLVIGREISTTAGARIDVLGIDGDGNLVVIECKRDRTPREVIAQLLDYGSWVSKLNPREIHNLALSKLKRPLADAFKEQFETQLPENLNTTHSLIVVATEFDPSSRRIVEYLAEVHKLSINAIFFSTFEHKGEDLLAIEWLLDQDEVVQRAESKTSAPWSGLYYVNIGETKDRHWEDMRKYGFVSAGGGGKYIAALKRLSPGDTILTYQKQTGYVGLGRVVDSAVPVDEFQVDGRPILDAELSAPDFGHDRGNLNWCEFVVRVAWEKTYPLSEAKIKTGVFANQNIVCKLRDPETIKFLGQYFPLPKGDVL